MITLDDIVNKAINLRGAVTFENYQDQLRVGSWVYVMVDGTLQFMLLECKCISYERIKHDTEGWIDVKITLEGKSETSAPVEMTIWLSQVNGHSSMLGYEKYDYSRIFNDKKIATEYYEQVKFIRDVQTDAQIYIFNQLFKKKQK